MKYIRTKDGIYNKSEIICYAFREEFNSPNWNDDIEKYLQTKIVAEADTIEELCDEFVVENKKDHLHINYANEDRQAIKMVIGNINKEEWFIYGAIWTEWGLKYVAKMNDKGELELI